MGLTLEGAPGGAPVFGLGAGLAPGAEMGGGAELWLSVVPLTCGLGLGSGLAALLPWLGVEPLEEAARDKQSFVRTCAEAAKLKLLKDNVPLLPLP